MKYKSILMSFIFGRKLRRYKTTSITFLLENTASKASTNELEKQHS